MRYLQEILFYLMAKHKVVQAFDVSLKYIVSRKIVRVNYVFSRASQVETPFILPDKVTVDVLSDKNQIQNFFDNEINDATWIERRMYEKISYQYKLWRLYYNGKLASVAVTIGNGASTTFFISMRKDDVYITHCKTNPEYRGKGFYSMLLKHVLSLLSAESVNTGICYISCSNWNIPSIKGITKIGFKKIGKGYIFRGKKRYRHLK